MAVSFGKIVDPLCKVVQKVENRSAKKLTAVNSSIAEMISKHNADGTDAAVASTKRYAMEQKQFVHYRVVRFFDECRYIGSGDYFRSYNIKNLVWDLRFFTKLLLLFIIGTLCGRRSVFPPIDPDSPLSIALGTKVNPNY